MTTTLILFNSYIQSRARWRNRMAEMVNVLVTLHTSTDNKIEVDSSSLIGARIMCTW